ncbi:Guanosine-diphosphatase, partial [Coemansia sp. RSA 2704]
AIQRRNTQSRDPTPATTISSHPSAQTAEPASSSIDMFRDTSAAYDTLGQYPKPSRLTKRLALRLVGIVLALCTLGYFGIAMLRPHQLERAEALDTRLLSQHCDRPHLGKPLVQYVLMLDAGSTGSRIHVYKFNYCKSQPELEGEVFEQIKPGLSSFKEDARGAAASLDSLMDVAMKHVPESLRGCTPVAVKATAGLRMLGSEQSSKILAAVEDHLRRDYPFTLVENPVEIMDGKDEGIYAWITVNYLLGTLGQPAHQTAATFDLGGGSTQIVFEPQAVRGGSSNDTLAAGAHRYEMSYGGEHYALYQHSYLGFGLMEARKSIKKMIARELAGAGKFSTEHPCFPPGFREEIATDTQQITVKGAIKQGLSERADACYAEVRKLFNKQAPCPQSPCTFDGVYQPALSQTFATNPFYIFSYFYDRTYPLGVRDQFSLREFKQLTDKVCSFDMDGFGREEQEEIRAESHYCLDLSFQYALLVDGVGMGENRTVRSTRKINDAETGWCLGASLAILDAKSYCK